MEHISDPKVQTTSSPSSIKRFTLDEANRSLVLVERVARDLVAAYETAVELRRDIELLDAQAIPAGAKREYEAAMAQLNGCVDELTMIGVELRDFESALCDFPAEHKGRTIFYSWNYPEPEILAWREVDDEPGHRRELSKLETTPV